MGKKSRRKGSGFENDIAKVIRCYLGATKEEVYRTPLSGGHPGFRGDIQVDLKYVKQWPLVIECKNREDWTFDGFISGTGFQYLYWAVQVLDVTKDNEIPVVLFTRNRMPIFAFLPTTQYEDCTFLSGGMGFIVVNKCLMIHAIDFFDKIPEIIDHGERFKIDPKREFERYKKLIRDRQKTTPRGKKTRKRNTV